MMAILNLLAVSYLAIFACSFWSTPVNALSIDNHHVARHNARGHDALAIRKRSNATKRCKARPAASTPPASTPPVTKPAPAPKAKAKATPPTTNSTSTSTTQSKAASTPATTPASSGSGKIGIAWANGDDPSLPKYKTPETRYLYTWGPYKPKLSDQLGFEFMAMLWCDDQIGQFQELVVEGYAHIALGPNEPNETGQCNISPQHAADLWLQYMEPLKQKGYTLFSPAVSSDPDGITWMQNFFTACKGCTIDYVAAHWYDEGADKFIAYMENFHTTLGRDIAVTEFACQNFSGGTQCTSDEIWSFMTTVIRWCESTSWIHSCHPFGFMHDLQNVNPLDSLMNADGSPSALGQLVITGAP